MKKDTKTVLITFSLIILIIFFGSIKHFQDYYENGMLAMRAADRRVSFIVFDREQKAKLAAELAHEQEEYAAALESAKAAAALATSNQTPAVVFTFPPPPPPPPPVVKPSTSSSGSSLSGSTTTVKPSRKSRAS